MSELGEQAFKLADELYPFCRSLTGDGVRQTLKTLQTRIPLDIHEVPSGTVAYDWVVPLEWNVLDAYVRDVRGRRVIDFRASNLHLVGYSMPFKGILKREDLLKHVYANPALPDWIPYRHTYFKESWGFCVTHRQREALTDEHYEVCVDTSLKAGYLTYGEFLLPGRVEDEVLVWTHTCHPSLGNDNLSGIVVATVLAAHLFPKDRQLTYRFLFGPATLGPLVWLSRNESVVPRIRHGFVLACVGDPGPVTYVKSRRGDAAVNRAMVHVLAHAGDPFTIKEFVPEGYDQRQFCSPGFDLPIGCFMRTPYGEYPEYHTSGDGLAFITPKGLGDSIAKLIAVFELLEKNRTYRNTYPKGEPQLGKRGLYQDAKTLGLWWILNYSDGSHTLLDIAERANMPFERIAEGAGVLAQCGLLQEVISDER